MLAVDVEALLVPYWRHRDAYDRGGSAGAFWGAVRGDLAAAGLNLADVGDAELDALDASRWARLADGSAALLADLSRAGTPTAVLSNAPASLAGTVRTAGWSSGFAELVFSSDLGLMKPEAEIYAEVERRTRRRPRSSSSSTTGRSTSRLLRGAAGATCGPSSLPARGVLTAAGALPG